MSDYRPWERPGTPAPATVTETPPPAPVQGATRAIEAPPGLAQAATRTGRPQETAAGMLLWTGGFLLIGGIVWMAMLSLGTELERISGHYNGHGTELAKWERMRNMGGLPVAASVLFLVPGVGLLYDQPWARPAAYAAAVVALLMPPFGTLLGIVALVSLSRMGGA